MTIRDYNLENGIIVSHDEFVNDVNAASKMFEEYDFCFTWVTVKALLDRIEELSEKSD